MSILKNLESLQYITVGKNKIKDLSSIQSLLELEKLTILLANPQKLKDVNILDKKVNVAEDANYINDGD
ncbi:hypothetical protein ABE354_24630 [Brevibacillus laterosporus]|uniref:hypothetical protein n=1 Tax=Brevibacillus laterosporus TaxID=1465 RepID=UPI003D1C154B